MAFGHDFLIIFSEGGEMNKVLGKLILFQTRLSTQSYDKKLVSLQRMANFFPYKAQGKKTFLFQSIQSTFAKPFWTCSFSSLKEDLTVKNITLNYYFWLGFLSKKW